ncbi:hypothetical protein D1003_00435 [Riemerella anatipestifer]|nr:hypothetical protein [Riemerella anatipestifer]
MRNKILRGGLIFFGIVGVLASVYNICIEKTFYDNKMGLLSSIFLLVLGIYCKPLFPKPKAKIEPHRTT